MQISPNTFAELLCNAKGIFVLALHKPWDYSPHMVNGDISFYSGIKWGSVEYRPTRKDHYFRFYEYDDNGSMIHTGGLLFPKCFPLENTYSLFATEYGLLIMVATRNPTLIKGYSYTAILLKDSDNTPA